MSNVSFDMVMAGVQQVFGEDSCRVRVVHAGAYTRVESRDMFHFVTIMSNDEIIGSLTWLMNDMASYAN